MPATVAAREDAGAASGTSFLVRLRSETRALHASTERRVAPAERLRDVGAYARLLAALYPLYASIEDRLEPFGADWLELEPPLDVALRRRAHLLVTDLASLGLDEPWRIGAAAPAIESFAQAFGALYVLEGSRLGGRVLARQVSAAVGAPASQAQRFLRGEGTEVGRLWTELRTALAGFAAGSDAGTRDDVIVGALETFRCFDRQLALWQP